MTDAADRIVLTQAPPPEARRADDTSSSSTKMTLHPLVVINVSDHFTRARAQSGGRAGTRVYGAILGEQIGRHVEIANSFELKMTTNAAGEARADPEYLRIRLEQYKKTFPKYDMLGWYSTGSEVLPSDEPFHQDLCEVTEGLLYMLLDPAQAMAPGNREVPVLIHESEVGTLCSHCTLCTHCTRRTPLHRLHHLQHLHHPHHLHHLHPPPAHPLHPACHTRPLH